jgi:hypothetical protein
MQELNRFMVAFVIFVMGHLPAPSAKHDQCNLNFYGALKNIAKIVVCLVSKFFPNYPSHQSSNTN